MKKSKLILSIFLTVFCLLSFAVPASAQYLGFDVGSQTGLSQQDPRYITANIIQDALGVLGIINLGIIIYSGFKWMTAGGNDEQVTEAKKWLTRSVIGLAIILSAYSITIFVVNSLIGANKPAGGYTWSVF